MTNRKKIAKVAKFLFKKSLTGGTVDAKKVQLIMKNLTKKPQAETPKLLKNYKRLVENALSWQQVVVEVADKSALDKKTIGQILSKSKVQNIIYRVNPKIIIGAKITHGDWQFDATLDAKLQQLTRPENSEYSVSQSNQ